MRNRVLMSVALVLMLPIGAWADPVPSAQPGGAASLQSGGAAVQGDQAAPAVGGSSADGGTLQPAVGDGSDGGASSAGLTAPVTSTLQQPAGTGDLRVLLGSEADGAPHNLSDDGAAGDWLLDGLVVSLLVLGGIAIALVRRRQLARAWARYAHRGVE